MPKPGFKRRYRSETEITNQRLVRVDPHSPKFTEEQKFKICELIASFHPRAYVREYVKREFGTTISDTSIDNYRTAPKWKPLVERFRQEYAAGVMDNKLAHKRTRVDLLMKQVDAIYNLSGGEMKALANPHHRREIRDILSQVREEMSESKTQFNTLIMSQVQGYSDEQLQKRLDEVVKKLKVLGAHTLPRKVQVQAEDVVELPVQKQDTTVDENLLKDSDTLAQLRETGRASSE